ncbi:MAG: hypothetical protein PVJ21_16180 [Anaerolineales bacterium]
MIQSNKNQLVINLAKDIVAEIAPQEMPMFRAQSEFYIRDPEEALKPQTGKDEMLGFGTESVATFITPTVLALSSVVVNFVVTTVKGSVQKETKNFIDDVVRSMFHYLRIGGNKEERIGETGQNSDKGASLPLTPKQIMELRDLVFSQALQLRLSEKTARLLADSFIGRLVASS